MRNERKYMVINYNKKLRCQIHVISYVICNDSGMSYVYKTDEREYINIFHYIKNYAKETIIAEQEGYEITENKTKNDVLAMYNNMQKF